MDGRKFLQGSDTELFAIAGERPARLLVLCGNRFGASRVIRSGEFAARMVRAGGGGSVAMVTCMVGDHQWMLAKDCMAVKVGERAFVFALPGVVYGLAVPRGCSENAVRKLEKIFGSYCAYHDLVARDDGSEARNPQPESETWIFAYEKLEKLAAKICMKITAASLPVFRPAIFGRRGATFDNAATKIQRAVRMSAAVKLASRALISGALIPHEHLHVSIPPAPALPSVCVLSDLLDAVESRGGATAAAAAQRGRVKGFWWLRTKGVELLLGVVRSYGEEARKKPRVDAASTSETAEEGGGKAAVEGLGKMKRFQPLETC